MGVSSSSQPSEASKIRTVRFHHLLCAVHHRVESPIAEALCIGTGEGAQWFARSIRAQTRDEFQKSLAFALESSSKVLDSQPLDERAVAKLIGPMQGRLEPGESASPLDCHCTKCGQVVTTTPARLVAGASGHAGSLYLADRGEVVARLDGYAEQLAARDQRAQKAARQRTRAIAAQGGEHAALVSLWQGLSPPLRRTLVSSSGQRTDDPMVGLLLHEIAQWCRRRPEQARCLGLRVPSGPPP